MMRMGGLIDYVDESPWRMALILGARTSIMGAILFVGVSP
jgi:hypothetical protein